MFLFFELHFLHLETKGRKISASRWEERVHKKDSYHSAVEFLNLIGRTGVHLTASQVNQNSTSTHLYYAF